MQKRMPRSHKRLHKSKKRTRRCKTKTQIYPRQREKLEQIQFRADLAEGRQAHAEREAQRLERERERLTREVAPLSAAAEAFRQASGKKPDKRQIPTLLAENARLEKELEYSIKDQHGLYTELQASEKENAALKQDADTLRTLRAHAPDKLQEAMDTAKRRRKKQAPALPRQLVLMDKIVLYNFIFPQLNIKKSIAFCTEIW